MNHKKIFFFVLIISVFAFSSIFIKAADAEMMSDTWRKLIAPRSSSIFTESIDLGGIRIGGRGKIMFTWLDRSLLRTLEKNRDVDNSIIDGLAYYYSSNKQEVRLVKNRDIFLLSYQAIKRWNFRIEDIVINGYRLTMDDILTHPYYRVLGEIAPLRERERIAIEEDEEIDDYQLYVAVPSMPRKGMVKISYGDDTVEWEIPRQ